MAKVLKTINNSIFSHIIEIDGPKGRIKSEPVFSDYGDCYCGVIKEVSKELFDTKVKISQSLEETPDNHALLNVYNASVLLSWLASEFLKIDKNFCIMFFEHINSCLIKNMRVLKESIYEPEQEQITMPCPY